jgi:hypothetical protein
VDSGKSIKSKPIFTTEHADRRFSPSGRKAGVKIEKIVSLYL